MGRPSCRQIVEELQLGDRRGCLHLAEAFQPILLREAVQTFHLLKQDAEEIVDDVLLAVVENIGTFEFRKGDLALHVWVISIFRNRVRDLLRKRNHDADLFRLVSYDGLLEEWGDRVKIQEGADDDEAMEGGGEPRDLEAELEAVSGDNAGQETGETEGRGSPDVAREQGAWRVAVDPADEQPGAEDALELIAETLDRLEPWERVLLRCRALDVPYAEIAEYTGKTVAQLKVYYPRVMKRFMRRLRQDVKTTTPSGGNHE